MGSSEQGWKIIKQASRFEQADARDGVFATNIQLHEDAEVADNFRGKFMIERGTAFRTTCPARFKTICPISFRLDDGLSDCSLELVFYNNSAIFVRMHAPSLLRRRKIVKTKIALSLSIRAEHVNVILHNQLIPAEDCWVQAHGICAMNLPACEVDASMPMVFSAHVHNRRSSLNLRTSSLFDSLNIG